MCNFIGGFAFKSEHLKNEKTDDEDLPVIKIGNVGKDGEININDVQYSLKTTTLDKFIIKKDDVLIAMTGATVGKVAISRIGNLLLNQRVGLVRAKEEKILKHFLSNILLSDSFYDFCQFNAGGGAQGNISPTQILGYEIPLPPLEIQQKIVDEIEAERVLVDGNKKLIQIYEGKVREAIVRVWGE